MHWRTKRMSRHMGSKPSPSHFRNSPWTLLTGSCAGQAGDDGHQPCPGALSKATSHSSAAWKLGTRLGHFGGVPALRAKQNGLSCCCLAHKQRVASLILAGFVLLKDKEDSSLGQEKGLLSNFLLMLRKRMAHSLLFVG